MSLFILEGLGQLSSRLPCTLGALPLWEMYSRPDPGTRFLILSLSCLISLHTEPDGVTVGPAFYLET